MKLHTNLTEPEVHAVLATAHRKGLIAPDVDYVVFNPERSQTHRYGYDIQLGTYDQDSLPAGYTDQNGRRMRVRHFKNSGSNGAGSVWAATWHEWGWLIAEMFEADPESRWGSNPAKARHAWGYFSAEDFNRKTGNQFLPVAD